MSGQKVVLTRKENNLLELTSKFPEIRWVDFPLIIFDYLKLSEEVFFTVNEHSDWLIFTSQNGARSFFDQSEKLKGKKIACVGPKTANVVRDFGYEVDFIPSHYTSITLAKELPSTPEENLCYIGGNLSSSDTLQSLREKAKHFTQLEVYHTVPKFHDKGAWLEMFSENPSIISFCSPSAVNSYVLQMDKLELEYPGEVKYAAIGTTTLAAIKNQLNSDGIIGEQHSFDGMLSAIKSYLAK